MNNKLVRIILLSLVSSSALTGCIGGDDNQDLIDFMEKEKRIQPRAIEPIPKFVPYEAFTYEAGALRSPFDAPLEVTITEDGRPASQVRPIENRVAEALEEFNQGDLMMVGTMTIQDETRALIQEPGGLIHPVSVGNYLGRSHGRITSISPTRIEFVEIVPNGPNNWIERERFIELKEASN